MSTDAIALDPGFAERFERERRPACQLYLISPPAFEPAVFAEHLRAALDGGPVAAFQLRLTDVSDEAVLLAADTLRPVLAPHDVAFLVDARADLAKRAGADGVHLDQGGSVADARALLGRDAQVGVSCLASRHFAMEAAEAGADYLSFGGFFPSSTKVIEHWADPALLGWWTTLSQLPCVAIGGITAANARPLVDAGADFLAVSAGVWAHEAGPGAAVRAFADLLG